MAIVLDGNGIAAVIAASVAGIVSLGTLAMQLVSWKDAREIKRLSLARDIQIEAQGKKLEVVKDLVNGKSEQLQAYVAKEAYEKGREHERVAPGTPSPVLAVTPVNTVVTAVPSSAPELLVDTK